MLQNSLQFLRRLIPDFIANNVKLAMKKGDKFTCPFCNFSASELATIGTNSKANREQHIIGAGLRNAGCYKCGSTDRERLVYLYLRDVCEILNPNKTFSVLHIAPEKNLIKKLRNAKNLEYVAGDRWIDKHEYYKGILLIDILSIPFPDNSFDIIICNHVLEHIPDDSKAMRELYRVLKPGGRAILQVPLSNLIDKTFEDDRVTGRKEREEIFGQQDHVRIYGPDYPDRLTAVGFHVNKLDLSLASSNARYGLNPEEKLFVGNKR